MRILAVLLFVGSLLLTGCFGSDENTTTESGLIQIQKTQYQMAVPASWIEVTSDDLSSPAAGTFELAYRSQTPRKGFYNNLVLISEARTGTSSTLEFVDRVVVRDGSQYASFESLDRQLIDLADGQESIVHTFRARYNAVTGEYIYLQSGALCDDQAYIITIGLDTDTTDEDLSRYMSIIGSFSCLEN